VTSPWTPEPRSFASWSVEHGSTRRITQDGRIRVTEQGIIRIIERFATSWANEGRSFSSWTTETEHDVPWIKNNPTPNPWTKE